MKGTYRPSLSTAIVTWKFSFMKVWKIPQLRKWHFNLRPLHNSISHLQRSFQECFFYAISDRQRLEFESFSGKTKLGHTFPPHLWQKDEKRSRTWKNRLWKQAPDFLVQGEVRGSKFSTVFLRTRDVQDSASSSSPYGMFDSLLAPSPLMDSNPWVVRRVFPKRGAAPIRWSGGVLQTIQKSNRGDFGGTEGHHRNVWGFTWGTGKNHT